MYDGFVRGGMTLENFLGRYDVAGAVVLLDGKRTVREEDQPLLEAIGEKLARMSTCILFRSGNAPGADFHFSKGVIRIDPRRLAVIKPFAAHRTAAALTSRQRSLDNIDSDDEESILTLSRINKKDAGLIDYDRSSKSGVLAPKTRYILRDTLKVTGAGDLIKKASFALFYDDHENPESGETGRTMMVCRKCGVPFVDQSVWMKWLGE